MDFEDLSPQILGLIGLSLSNEDLNQLCSLHSELEVKLCSNQEFWQQKYLRDFERPEKIPLIWREAYRQKIANKILYLGHLGMLGQRSGLMAPRSFSIKDKIISISAGNDYSLILTQNGKVYGFGNNFFGQLGSDRPVYQPIPKQISLGLKPEEKIIAISAGGGHSLILTENGEVYVFGDNDDGQLGLDDNQRRSIPEKIPLAEKIISISAGHAYSLILSETGRVYAFGNDDFGQLGLGEYGANQITPERISLEEKFISISASFNHSLILTENGEVYSFGFNEEGQLGLRDDEDRFIPEKIPLREKIISISNGTNHSLILSENNEVFAFGSNPYGQLGLNDQENRFVPTKIFLSLNPEEKIVAISAGHFHSLILTDKGRVYGFGNNYSRQLLGLGDQYRHQLIPKQIPSISEEKIISISAGNDYNLFLIGTYALFSSIQTLIQNEWVKNYEYKYKTSGTTAIFEFIDLQDESYLIEVIYDPKTNQIFELK